MVALAGASHKRCPQEPSASAKLRLYSEYSLRRYAHGIDYSAITVRSWYVQRVVSKTDPYRGALLTA
eukprot:7218665-Prymnesium_polylepis.1